MSLTIRRARPDEAGLVLSLVRELAEYEKLLHEVEATEAMIAAALFGDNPRLFCEIAEWNGEPAGFAVWFINFSTFSGRSGIYLEDLFVRPAQRGKGIGKALLVASCETMRGERLVAIAMVGAGLEYAVDRILQIARRGLDGRMDDLPGRRSGADGAGGRSALMEIVLIVAVADNGVIGADGAIPWRLKTDQQRFKAMTLGKPVVMGRKTFLSLRRPLPGRTNIVSRAIASFRAAGAVVTTSFDAARAVALGDALRRSVAEIAVIGGAEIYAQWMAIADRLEITEVHARPEGDTCFAAIDAAVWEEVARVRNPAGPDDSADFSYVTYRRRKPH